MALVPALPHHGSPGPFPPKGHSLIPGHSSLGLSTPPPLTPPGLGRESSLLVLGDPQVGFVPPTHTHTCCYSPSAPLHPPKPSASCLAPNDGHSEMPGPCVPLWYLRTPWGQTLHPPCVDTWLFRAAPTPGAALSKTQRTDERGTFHLRARLKVGPADTFGPHQLGHGARQEARVQVFANLAILGNLTAGGG